MKTLETPTSNNHNEVELETSPTSHPVPMNTANMKSLHIFPSRRWWLLVNSRCKIFPHFQLTHRDHHHHASLWKINNFLVSLFFVFQIVTQLKARSDVEQIYKVKMSDEEINLIDKRKSTFIACISRWKNYH